MNVGQAAKLTGVSRKPFVLMRATDIIVHRRVRSLRFIRRARDPGLSAEQISALLVLWRDRDLASADVKALALSHAARLKAQIAELQTMVETLEHLADHCRGNDRPDCPILTDLARRLEIL